MGTAIPVAPNVAAALAEYRRGRTRISTYWWLRGHVDVGDEIERTSYLHQDICLEHELVIGPIFLAEQDFRERRSPFLGNIRKEGIEL